MLQQRACPLCDSDAQSEATTNPAGHRISCPECIEFWIDAASESTLAGFPEVVRSERRGMLSKKAANVGPGKLLVLRAPRPAEVAHEGPGVARTNMFIEVVSRD